MALILSPALRCSRYASSSPSAILITRSSSPSIRVSRSRCACRRSAPSYFLGIGRKASGWWRHIHPVHQRAELWGVEAGSLRVVDSSGWSGDSEGCQDRVPRSGVPMWSSRFHRSHAPAGPTSGQGPFPRPGTASTPLQEPCRSMLRRRSPERGGSDSCTTSRDATSVRGRCGSQAV